jgi:hypothetical protein
VGPFADEMEKIASGWQHDREVIALCQGKVGKNWRLASPESNIAHFGMEPAYPYYNSGIWILRSEKVLREWASEVKKTPKNGMFEQDAFNYLLFRHTIRIHTLDNDRFNVTHDSLNRVIITPDGRVLLNEKEPLIIHLTGVYKTIKVSIGPFRGTIRSLVNPEVRNLQLQLLKEWVISISK